MAHDAAQSRHQAVERGESLSGLAARAGDAVDALIDQLVDAQLRHDVLDAGDGDADGAVEPAVLVHGERAGADDDRIGALDAQRFDLDIAAGRLHLAEPLGQRLGRQILKAAHHDLDVALQRFGEQRMHRRRVAAAKCRTVSITGLLSAEPATMRALKSALSAANSVAPAPPP